MSDISIFTYLYIFVHELAASQDVSISLRKYIKYETCNKTTLAYQNGL